MDFARTAVAQQNLFNVPDVVITAPGKVFFQEQFNFTRSGVSNTTFCYGVGKELEIGFNVFNVDLYTDPHAEPDSTPENLRQVSPEIMFNVARGLKFTERWHAELGAQFGVNPADSDQLTRFTNFTYFNTEYNAPGPWGKYYVGTYYANHHHAGPGNSVGLLLGTEIPLVKEKLHFMADFLSGTNDLSVGVIGGVLFIPKRWQLSAGWQFPSPGSHNMQGLVLEITRM